MPNPHWNNQHGANVGHPGEAKEPSGKPMTGSGSDKTANWPGLPGPTQPKDRSAGQPKRGHKGEFYVKKVGL